jgi:Na+-driven multidrug efflux pump
MSEQSALRRRISALAVPIMLAALISVLVQLVVVALLGRLSDQALYVRSLYLPVAFLILALQEGLDVSTQVAVAVGHGRGDRAGIGPLAGSFVRLGLGVFGAACVVITLAAPALAGLLAAGPADRAVFVAFVRWSALAALATVGPTVLAATLRGWGRAAASAAVSTSVAVAQVGLVAVLGFGTGLGVFSVPVATVAGSVVGLVTGALGWRGHGLPRIDLLAWRTAAARTLLAVGGPVATSYLLLFGVNLGLLWILGPFGPSVVSGFSTAYTVQTVLIVPAIALGSATAIVMNQLRGQHRDALLPSVFLAGVRLALVGYAVVAAAAWLGRGWLARTVTGSPVIADQVQRYLGIVAPTIALMGLVLVSVTVLEQLGAGVAAVLLNLGYFGAVLVIGGLLARQQHDFGSLYWTIAITNLVGAPLAVPLAATLIRRRVRRQPVHISEPMIPVTATEGPT